MRTITFFSLYANFQNKMGILICPTESFKSICFKLCPVCTSAQDLAEYSHPGSHVLPTAQC